MPAIDQTKPPRTIRPRLDPEDDGREPSKRINVTPIVSHWAHEDLTAPVAPIDYLVEKLDLFAGAPAMLAGLGFVGKSIVLQQAAVDIALDRRVWGEFAARKGARVLHIDGEQGRVTVTRYQRIARAAGVDLAEISKRLSVTMFPPLILDSSSAEAALARECQGFDLVILDSYRAFVRTVDENSSEARTPLDMLGRVSTKIGATFVVIHHARKPVKDAPGGAKATIRGSGALFDACGSVVVLSAERGEPTCVEHVKARSTGKPANEFFLAIEDVPIDGDATAGLRVLHQSTEQAKPRKEPAKVHSELMERIRGALKKHPDVPGKKALLARMGVKSGPFFTAFAELEALGEVVNLGTYHKPRLRLQSVPAQKGGES